MKVNVEFLSLQLVTRPLGRKSIDVEFDGRTFADLVSVLSSSVKRFAEVVVGKSGGVDHDIQVYVNGYSVDREGMESRLLTEGDKVTFMLLLAGG